MLIFFADHPTPGTSYEFTDLLTGEKSTRTITQRVKRSRYSDVFRCKQIYFEVTMVNDADEEIVAEYEIDN